MNIKVFVCLVLVVAAVNALPVVNLGLMCDVENAMFKLNGTSHGALQIPCTLTQIDGQPIGTAIDDPTPTEALLAVMTEAKLTQTAIAVEILNL